MAYVSYRRVGPNGTSQSRIGGRIFVTAGERRGQGTGAQDKVSPGQKKKMCLEGQAEPTSPGGKDPSYRPHRCGGAKVSRRPVG